MSANPLTLDRTISLSLVLTIIIQSASALLWVGAAEVRLMSLESAVNMKPPVSERLARIEEQMEMTRQSLTRIERQLYEGRKTAKAE